MELATAAAAGLGKLQDRMAALEFDGERVLVLADGAGGMSHGAEAAEGVLEIISARAHSLTAGGDPWCEVLREADEELSRRKSSGESTAVVVHVGPGGIRGASVGDSGAWLIQPEGRLDLTRNQRAKPLIGSGAAFPVGFSCALSEGVLLVASDGLLKYASAQDICGVVGSRDLAAAAAALIDMVRLRSGTLQDDASVMLLRL